MKKILCVVIAVFLMTSIVYAEPSGMKIGVKIGKWMNKYIEKGIKAENEYYKKLEKKMMKEYEEKLISETLEVYNKYKKQMTDKQLEGLKELVNELIDDNKKLKTFEKRNKREFQIRGRLHNKKLTGGDHKKIREYIKNNHKYSIEERVYDFVYSFVPYLDTREIDKTDYILIPLEVPVPLGGI